MSCLNRKNGCFDRSHSACGTARPQGWGTASLLGLISFFLRKHRIPIHICLLAMAQWLSEPGKQDLTGRSVNWKKITTKCDKTVTNPVAWGSDNASATTAWDLCFSEAQNSASKTGCHCQWADVWNNLGQGEPKGCFRSKRWGKSFSYLFSCNSQFPKVSDMKGLWSRDYWFWTSC